MATIRIAETLHPTRSHSNPPKDGIGGGVYSTRNISRSSLERRSSRGRTRSVDRRSLKSGDNEGIEDEDSGLRQAGDYKKRQV
jgi:KUP system potassium uptake protein